MLFSTAWSGFKPVANICDPWSLSTPYFLRCGALVDLFDHFLPILTLAGLDSRALGRVKA